MKKCYVCKNNKDFLHFGRNKSEKDGLQSKCKECLSEYNSRRYKNNPKVLIKISEWNSNNRDKVKKIKENYKIENPEKVKASKENYKIKNPEKVKACKRKYEKDNPGKKRALLAKRRARKFLATPSWLTKEHFQQIEVFYIEAARLSKETGIPHEVDHIEPLQGKDRSGLHVPWNLQILTKLENRKKGNKAPI